MLTTSFAQSTTDMTSSSGMIFKSFTTPRITGATNTASTFSNGQIYIPNYAGSNNKSFSVDNVTERNATSIQMCLMAGRLANTSAITSISLVSQTSSNLVQHSTATLYGIKNS